MRFRSSDVHQALTDLASAPSAAPDPAFAARLENRLRALAAGELLPVTEPARRRPSGFRPATPRWIAMAAAAAAVVMAVAGLHPVLNRRDARVTHLGSDGSTTVTTTPARPGPPDGGGPPTTLSAPPPPAPADPAAAVPPTTVTTTPRTTTTRPAPVAAPTTTTTVAPAEHPATTTTTPRVEPPPSTTTTTAHPVQVLNLGCVSSAPSGQPTVSCSWSRSTDPAFASYRLKRATMDGPWQVVFTSTSVTGSGAVDKTPAAGITYRYVAEALDAGGAVIGASAEVTVPCCTGA